MRFKELYPSTQWRFSDTAFYLFQQPSTALEVCTVICAQNTVCRAVFIDQDVCFGISTLMSASSMHSKVRTFVKQPSNGMYCLNEIHLIGNKEFNRYPRQENMHKEIVKF